MAENNRLYSIQGSTLTDIADAIREKSGSTQQYSASEMAPAVLAIQSGGIGKLPDNLAYLDQTIEGQAFIGYGSAVTVDKTGADVEEINPIFQALYPVGSIYMSVTYFDPASVFGGAWEQIGQGRTLFGAGNGYEAGTTIEAGLPNITGQYAMDQNASSLLNTGGKFAGAFTSKPTLSNSTNGVQYSANNNGLDLAFDASLSNPIYGNSETVQPPAFVVYMWRRVA